MLFHSLVFFGFLALVLAAHRLLPWRVGRVLLLAASYGFYGAVEPAYVLLLMASTALDFGVGLALQASDDPRRRKLLVLASLTVNLGLLGTFKYADWLLTSLGLVDAPPLARLGWVLPIGISFFTFQTIGYTLDVYRRDQRACRDPLTFALYVSFFPQLVAGPIERAGALLPQLARRRVPTAAERDAALQRILWGLVKKLVVAERLGFLVQDVFNDPTRADGSAVALATLAATARVYLDFSAYTDIAIGVAGLFGVGLSENFRWPLLATSPADFWRRWHITLTLWFRDYVARPLAGSGPDGPGRRALRTLFVMTLVGLWHGAAATYLAFGVVAGVGLALSSWRRAAAQAAGRWRPPVGWRRLPATLGTLAYVHLCMLLFVSPDLTRAEAALARLVTGPWRWDERLIVPGLALALVAGLHVLRGGWSGARQLALPAPLRGLFWAGLVLLLLYGAPDRVAPFVYFQF